MTDSKHASPRQFCPLCGSTENLLPNGLCLNCYDKQYNPGKINKEPYTLTICGSCHAIQTGKNSWTEPLDPTMLEHVLHERLHKNIHLSYPEDHVHVVFNEEDFLEHDYPIMTIITYNITHVVPEANKTIQRKLQGTLRLEKGICKRCANIKLGVAHALVQVRRETGSMSDADIDESIDILRNVMNREIRTSGDYIPKIEEKHGGIDFHVSEKHLADEIGQSLIHAFGGKMQTTFKLVGEDKDGKKKYKTTISVRLPLLRVNDHVFYNNEIYKVTATNGDGVSIVSYLHSQAHHLSWKQVKELEPIDSYLIKKTMLITAITEDSVFLMNLEDNSYEELEMKKTIFPPSLQESTTIIIAIYKDKYYYLGSVS